MGKGESEVIEDAVRRELGFDLLDRLWARNDLAEDEALALALEAQHSSRQSDQAARLELTRRQLEVLALLAAGKSSKEIAEQLSIAVKTTENHVRNIMDKLALTSRAAVPTLASRHAGAR